MQIKIIKARSSLDEKIPAPNAVSRLGYWHVTVHTLAELKPLLLRCVPCTVDFAAKRDYDFVITRLQGQKNYSLFANMEIEEKVREENQENRKEGTK